MNLAIEDSSMEERMYNEMARKRDELVEMMKNAKHPKHRAMITDELTNIRKQLKEAHHERYHNERTS